MLLYEELKIAFLFPVKTGSTTATEFLKQSKFKYRYAEDKHVFLSQAKKLFPQLEHCKIYCFFRNPIERFASHIVMVNGNPSGQNILNAFKNKISGKDYINCMDVYFKNNSRYFGGYFLPQFPNYLNASNVHALDFANYDFELRKASQELELDTVEIKKENIGQYDKLNIDKSELVAWLTPYMKDHFAEDCKFMYEKFGRRINA